MADLSPIDCEHAGVILLLREKPNGVTVFRHQALPLLFIRAWPSTEWSPITPDTLVLHAFRAILNWPSLDRWRFDGWTHLGFGFIEGSNYHILRTAMLAGEESGQPKEDCDQGECQCQPGAKRVCLLQAPVQLMLTKQSVPGSLLVVPTGNPLAQFLVRLLAKIVNVRIYLQPQPPAETAQL